MMVKHLQKKNLNMTPQGLNASNLWGSIGSFSQKYKHSFLLDLTCNDLESEVLIKILRVPYVQFGHVRGVFWGKIEF